MKTIELRKSDMRRAKNLNAKNGYGLDVAQMNSIIIAYQKAKRLGDSYKCSLIEYRLTDINYHNEVELLKVGKYDELKQQIKNW